MSRLLEKPLPFVTEDSENSSDKTYKYLSRGMGFLFSNDQRNVLWFALGLGIPGIIAAFVGLFITSWGHPVLIIFDILIALFVFWVFYNVTKLLK